MSKGRNTTVIGVRVPDALHTRIATLANKGGITINEWCRAYLMKCASLLPSGEVRRHKKR